MAGTATMVRSSAGMPCRSASLGSCRGGIADVSRELSMAIASSLTGTSARNAISQSVPSVAP